jgi:acetyl esterase
MGEPGGVVLSPATKSFLESLKGSPPINSLAPEEARQVLIDAQTSADVEMLAASVEEKTLPVGPAGEVKVYVVRPDGSEDETLPGVVYFHGGGWILGNFTTHERLVRELANKSDAAYVFVEYAPAPEEKHPHQLEEGYAVLEYIADNADEFGIDAERLATAGDSVGGHMVAVIAMMAEAQGGPEIDAQVMFYPVTTANLTTDSYATFSEGPWLTKPAMEWFWNAYLPEGADRNEVMISPLQASSEDIDHFAPTLVITDENDVLRDEGELFADKLVLAGVEVETARYPHTIHDFVMLNGFTNAPEPRAAIEQAAGFLSRHLDADMMK